MFALPVEWLRTVQLPFCKAGRSSELSRSKRLWDLHCALNFVVNDTVICCFHSKHFNFDIVFERQLSAFMHDPTLQ
jgi:hypothetical protein